MEGKVMMKDWKFPLTNICKCGNSQVPRPSARVRDAEDNLLMDFAGLPSRRNHEAVAMATEFCEEMNRMYKQRRNCDVGTAEEQYERCLAFCAKYNEDCIGCPCDDSGGSFTNCFAKWMQLPYEEGGAR